jgi:hypothetical protein
MNSKHVSNALIVLCLIALVAWWHWRIVPAAAKPPTNSQQLAHAPSPPTDAPTANPPPEPGNANVDPAVLQALAQAVAQQPTTTNSVIQNLIPVLPPGGQLAEPFTPGRPTVVGQRVVTQKQQDNGRITLTSDVLEGFIPIGPAGNVQYVPSYRTGVYENMTPDGAAKAVKQFSIGIDPFAPGPVGFDPFANSDGSVHLAP